MQDLPRVGLILMRADWLGCDEAQGALESIQNDTAEIVNHLGKIFQVLGPWVVDSLETLQACQYALRDTDLDMVILAFQTLAEDIHLVSLVQAVGSRPLVLWCYVPWRRLPRPLSALDVMRGSGLVGTFSALGTLRNLDASFLFTFGAPDDPRLVNDLSVAGQAAVVRRALRTARFGLLPSHNDRVQSTFVDEFRLMADFGPVVQYISVSEYQRAVDSLPKERVDSYLALLQQRYLVKDVSDETLRQAARCALGLAQLAAGERLNVLAVNDAVPELYRAFQMRPALYPDLLEPGGALYLPEGDLCAATANFILQQLTGSPTMFLELWFWDEPKNQLIGGHTGMQNPAIAETDQVWVGPDFDYCHQKGSEGAQFHLVARPGRVTMFQLRSTPKGWQAIALSGVCLEAQVGLENSAYAVLRLDAPIEHFLNRIAEIGTTQHWVMVYGSVLHPLEAFCQMQKIPLEVITY